MSNRCFGSVPEVVAEMVYAFIRALQREGVAAFAKHFLGLGHSTVDGHLALPSLPFSLDRLKMAELPPFQKALEADVATIMLGHINAPSLTTGEKINREGPATLTKLAIDYLRNEFLFEGLMVGDSLEMGATVKNFPVEEAAVQAVLAGDDMVMICHKQRNQIAVIDTLANAILNGRLLYDRVKEAKRTINKLGQTYCRLNPPQHDVLVDGFQEARMDAKSTEIL